MAKLTIEEIIAAVKELTVLELNDLVKAAEEEFGVSAAAGVAVVAGPAAGDAAAEKTEFDVELTEVGSEKIKVIKVVREVTGLGLKEAKEAVDNAPKVLKEQASKEGEILAADSAAFYDFDAKYNNAESKTVVDPEMPEESKRKIKEDAEAIKAKLEEVGAKVTLK